MINRISQVVTLLVFGVLVAAVTAPAHADGATEDLCAIRASLVAVTEPDLELLDTTVAQQLTQARHEMEATISKPQATSDELASAYGSLGQIYHAYELLDEAQACYTNAMMLDPQNFAWVHLRGDVSRIQGRLDEAAAEFEAAWSLEPLDFAAIVKLGNALLELNREDEARQAFRQALALSPGSPSVMAGLGQLALRQKEYEDAVAYFTAALTAVPDANRLHYSLAMAYRGLGKIDEAKYHLEQRGTVGVKPPDPIVDALQPLREGERVHLVRGRLAFAAKRFEEAQTEFELAVEGDPSSVRALVNLGATQAQLGDIDGAVGRFEEALQIDPSNSVAQFNLGSLLARRGAYDEAISHLQTVADTHPEDAEVQLEIARCLVASGDDLASLPYFRLTSKLEPGSANAVVEGASALTRLRRFDQAVNVLEAGFDRIPANGPIAAALARLLAGCPDGELRNGERALALSLALQETDPKPHHMQLIARSLAEIGECEKASEWQRILIENALKDGMTDVADGLRPALRAYEDGPPCRPPMDEVSPAP